MARNRILLDFYVPLLVLTCARRLYLRHAFYQESRSRESAADVHCVLAGSNSGKSAVCYSAGQGGKASPDRGIRPAFCAGRSGCRSFYRRRRKRFGRWLLRSLFCYQPDGIRSSGYFIGSAWHSIQFAQGKAPGAGCVYRRYCRSCSCRRDLKLSGASLSSSINTVVLGGHARTGLCLLFSWQRQLCKAANSELFSAPR
ncbi:MAG: hypothetical protein ACD_39C00392G0002 [uncultured bacterium]|nr:MAG: hypothetical protein ACD_39C00392G0002 [uncultured bacterium]